MKKNNVFILRIDEKTKEALKSISQQREESQSEIVRQLIHQAVNQPDKQFHQADCAEVSH